MTSRIRKRSLALCVALSALCLYAASSAPAGTLLPEGLVMEDVYSPGRGRSIGVVQQVQGDVVLMHAGGLKGYTAARGMRLYKGDTLITLAAGRIRFRLNDGSILSLAAETKLTLTRSVFEKKKKRRSSFFQMALGKARFFVVKMLDFKRSEFKVKTPTAVCGVRGSDFILEASESKTIATALMDTELEYWSHAFLEDPPMILRDYEMSIALKNQKLMEPIRLPQHRIEEKKAFFIDVSPETGAAGEAQTAGQEEALDDTGVDDVTDLEDALGLEETRPQGVDASGDYDEISGQIKPWTPAEIDTIKASITESSIAGELPAFPEKPE